MSPAVRHYLTLKRRLRATIDQRNELFDKIVAAEKFLEALENAFTPDELREWRELDTPKSATSPGIANVR